MPRWKTPRWTLGAPALVALAVAGCGTAASRPRLHNAAEKRLLTLVSHARADASAHSGARVRAVLGRFVADVRTLRSSGQLSPGTAAHLDEEARATAEQAAQLLRAPASRRAVATPTSRPQARVDPPAGAMPPHRAHGLRPPGRTRAPGRSEGAGPPGHGHGRGHAYGHAGRAGAPHGGGRPVAGQSQGVADQNQSVSSRSVGDSWAQWWQYVTGGGRD